jgi:hypothetical protein
LTSADIDVVGGASLGQAGLTQLLTLNAVSSGPAIVLGAGDGVVAGQYQLSEAGDIRADTLVINAIGAGESGAPDILMLNAGIDGSNTAGGGISHVALNTAGSVLVRGAVLVSNAAATDSLTINAGDSIQINTSSGGRIAIAGSNGAPSGVLALNANKIWSGDQSLLQQLATNPDFAGRDAALAANSGPDNPAGNLSAGSMSLGVGQSLFVQNSGTATEFAGITVGAGGLTIHSTGSAPAAIVAYGRKLNADGSVSTGVDFLGQIIFDQSGAGYSDGSQVNGCDIGAATCGALPQTPGAESILGPVGLMGDPDASDEDYDGDLLLGLIDTTALSDDDPVDDPVTSGSDSGQWSSDRNAKPKDH